MAVIFTRRPLNLRALLSVESGPAVCSRCKRRLPIRLCSGTSDPTGEELDTFEGPIPREKLNISFSKSSGPGGQNVNKLSTKAEVRFHVSSADWLPQRVKDRLHTMFKSRLTKEGDLIVTCQVHRSQRRNLETAVDKLEEMIQEASEVPRSPSNLTIARIKTLKKKAQQRKRAEKKYHSQKKQERNFMDLD